MTKRVLIIDDDDDTRIIYARMLQFAGYDCEAAVTGEMGLSTAATFQPDLVILDVSLPGISGWDVCERLKQMAETAATKIVIVTAHAFIDEGPRAEQCGAEILLTKPLLPFVLREHIQRLIGPPAPAMSN